MGGCSRAAAPRRGRVDPCTCPSGGGEGGLGRDWRGGRGPPLSLLSEDPLCPPPQQSTHSGARAACRPPARAVAQSQPRATLPHPPACAATPAPAEEQEGRHHQNTLAETGWVPAARKDPSDKKATASERGVGTRSVAAATRSCDANGIPTRPPIKPSPPARTRPAPTVSQ